ncbi:MAG TPA: hypothetical protein VII78_02860 [Myxococcota bacterium]
MSARLLLAVAALTALGCVSAAHEDVLAARARYEQCVRAARSEAECRAERERMLAAERTYQERAGQVWGCDPAQADCPPTR